MVVSLTPEDKDEWRRMIADHFPFGVTSRVARALSEAGDGTVQGWRSRLPPFRRGERIQMIVLKESRRTIVADILGIDVKVFERWASKAQRYERYPNTMQCIQPRSK